MELKPPADQRIVNDYFNLLASRKLKNVAWLYGMIATYGIKPDKLWDFSWGPENSIIVKSRKKPIYPLHPQWVILFGLKQEIKRSKPFSPCIVRTKDVFDFNTYLRVPVNGARICFVKSPENTPPV